MKRTGVCCVLMLLATIEALAQGTVVEPSPVQPTDVQPTPVQPTFVQPTPIIPTEVRPNTPSTLITLETDTERIEGELLDETAAGYLVRTATGTRLVRYEAVKRVSRGLAASSPPRLAPPAVPAAPVPPAPQHDVSATHHP